LVLAVTWLALAAPAHSADTVTPVGPSAVERTLVEELDRALAVLGAQPEKPHYIALAVTDQTDWRAAAEDGTLASRREDQRRVLDVDLRVGDPTLDSTRPLRGFSSLEGSSRGRSALPPGEGAEDALRHAVWHALDAQYRGNAQRIVMIRAERTVKVEEEVQADDFEPRDPVVARQVVPQVQVDLDAWGEVLVDLSETLDASSIVTESEASLAVNRTVKTFVDTEGTRLVHGTTHARLSLTARTVAADGDVVTVFRAFDVHDPSSLPDPDALDAWVSEATTHLANLRDAPRGTPYSGPVLLEGKATAVFFHEVFGHRVEGHRQKRESEGRTFAAKVGEPILPDFIDVYDDPTLDRLAGFDLNGHYAFDDEGVPAARATLVEDGRFAGFLMGRSPLPEVQHSNGHGRRQPGNAPVSRMGNTIIEASKTVSSEQLRNKLRDEVRAQGLSYGYVVTDIDGGFTMTGRITPNAFNVRANTTYRVYADGRPDELVRGIDLVGTPLVAFRNIVAASDRVDVFNGHCGAESGWVPVSAVAPGILVRRLEFQLKEKGQERPPLLPKPLPPRDGTSDAGGER
jgi:predicted Zn-dependent protease